MRLRKLILALALPLIAVGLIIAVAPFFRKTGYRRFLAHDTAYYAQLAQACDTVLQQHPLGTNRMLLLPGREPDLPLIVRQLAPEDVILRSHYILIDVDEGRESFGVLWEPAETNRWFMHADYQGRLTSVYSQPAPPR